MILVSNYHLSCLQSIDIERDLGLELAHEWMIYESHNRGLIISESMNDCTDTQIWPLFDGSH